MDSPVDILVAAAAGDRVVELAQGLRDEIARSGRESTLALDWLPAPVPGRVPCLVLPHAPFIRWASAEAHIPPVLRRAVVICTGPLDSATANLLRVSRAVLALRADARHALALAGIHALPLDAPLAEPAAGDHERDLDVVVCEGWTAERARMLASCARVLDGRRCDLRASYVGGTRAGVLHLPDAASRRALLRRARVALIVGNGPSLEPLSAVEAAGCGAVVVTDARLDLGPFTAGYDVLRADEAALPTVARRAAQRCRARAGSPRRRVARRCAARASSSRPPSCCARAMTRRAPPRTRRTSIPEPIGREATTEGTASPTGLGPLVIEVRTQRRRLARLEQSLSPDASEPRVVTTPAWATAEPELSVLIPLHDYERYVEEACRSALAARDVRLELVVVDDASSDRGADRVEALLESQPDAAAALVRLPSNVGIAGARNHAASVARSPLLLFLDADDALLPHGPARLRDALLADPRAAFAYGLLAVEGPEGPRGLLNAEPWNPDLLREGNYINALALVRAEAYRRVGGYHDDGPLEIGWEDYDLWLRMAEAGEHGVQVRELVARYRAHAGSRTVTADEVADDLMTYLRGRYPRVLGSAASDERRLDRPRSLRARAAPPRGVRAAARLRAAARTARERAREGGPRRRRRSRAISSSSGNGSPIETHSSPSDQQLADVVGSASWQVTRPLRTLKSRLREPERMSDATLVVLDARGPADRATVEALSGGGPVLDLSGGRSSDRPRGRARPHPARLGGLRVRGGRPRSRNAVGDRPRPRRRARPRGGAVAARVLDAERRASRLRRRQASTSARVSSASASTSRPCRAGTARGRRSGSTRARSRSRAGRPSRSWPSRSSRRSSRSRSAGRSGGRAAAS